MKTLAALLVSTMLASTANAAVIAKAYRSAGFSPNPQTAQLVLEDNGKLTLTVKELRTGKTTVTQVAQYSAYAIKYVKERLTYLNPATEKLVDPEMGKPMCTDAPSTSIKLTIKGTDLEIYRWAGCHEWNLESGNAKFFVDLLTPWL